MPSLPSHVVHMSFSFRLLPKMRLTSDGAVSPIIRDEVLDLPLWKTNLSARVAANEKGYFWRHSGASFLLFLFADHVCYEEA